MTKGSKRSHQIIDTERITGQTQLRSCITQKILQITIRHMHELNIVHADIKPHNVIHASDGDIKLIDLDASVKVGDVLTKKKKSTLFVLPEVTKIEFQPKERLDDIIKEIEEKKEWTKLN